MTAENQISSVWDALEDTPEEAENMKIRSALLIALIAHVREKDLSQTEAAKFFGVTQPRISDLMRGKVDLFSLDTLVNLAAKIGIRLEIRECEPA